MDPLTHAFVATALADALPMPKIGKRVTAFALFMGAVPDIDLAPAFFANFPANVLSAAPLFDPYWAVLHRGVTHSLVFAAVFGALAGWGFRRVWARSGTFRKWAGFAVLVLLSHIAIDLVSKGVDLWAPFSDARVRIASLPLIDLPTLLPVTFCFVTNRWTEWGRLRARRNAIMCLAFVAVEIAARVLLA